jgi:RimJ/RimL family protein N-acetyltransferase
MPVPIPGAVISIVETSVGNCLFRYPTIDDAEQMLRYINAISLEQTYINMQGEQLTIDAEIAWLTTQLREIEAGNTVQLLSVLDDEIIGVAGIHRQSHVAHHTGVLGISVAKAYRGLGIGRSLMTTLIAEAKARISGLSIISLDVFGSNEPGIHLYQSLGFLEYGRLPGGIIHQGNEVDRISMYLRLR